MTLSSNHVYIYIYQISKHYLNVTIDTYGISIGKQLKHLSYANCMAKNLSR